MPRTFWVGSWYFSGERSPAIQTIEEFVGESEPKLRMISQIADSMNVRFLGGRSLHDERIGIVKPKLASHAHSKFLKLKSHLGRGSGR